MQHEPSDFLPIRTCCLRVQKAQIGEERPNLVPYVGPFDGFYAVPASVSKTCLVRFDKNRYSVDARAVGRPVEIRAYADRLECWQDGRIVGRHDRAFVRGKTIYDPLHYIPVLARKPGALRNGAPFKEWDLRQPLRRRRRRNLLPHLVPPQRSPRRLRRGTKAPTARSGPFPCPRESRQTR